MSTKQSQTKNKISDVAKDLKVSNQELAELVSEKFGAPRKPSASINQEELNYILEYYSQNNQVDSFDSYYASKNDKPAPKPAAEKPASEKKPAAKKNDPKQPKSDAPEKDAKKEAAKAPAQVKETKKPEAPKAAPKTEVAKTEAPRSEAQKPENKPQQNIPVRKETQKSAMEKFENQIKKSNEQKKNQAAKASEKKQEAKPAENNKSTKTKLGGNFSNESVKVEQKIRTVDTRGSYVDIDKYNEKYENIAPVNGGGGGKHGKDNFSKKMEEKAKEEAKKAEEASLSVYEAYRRKLKEKRKRVGYLCFIM